MRCVSYMMMAWFLALPMLGFAQGGLTAFRSEQELTDFMKQTLFDPWEQLRQQKLQEYAKSNDHPLATLAASKPMATESITNNQVAGVDEGGIVKAHGHHLVVLHRGRLFSLRLDDQPTTPLDVTENGLRVVSSMNAFGDDVEARGTWYDELLISGDRVFVIGYSYSRGGTEIGLFRINDQGELSYLSTYQIRSSDYYSSRNYASRVVGDKLVFYTPYRLSYSIGAEDGRDTGLPAMRRWDQTNPNAAFKSTMRFDRTYRPLSDADFQHQAILHSVTTCEVLNDDLDCSTTSVFGQGGRVFYVSADAVYIWTPVGLNFQSHAWLYRMPLNGDAPRVIQVTGSPIDQFSFYESPDAYLNVLVGLYGQGDGMWNALSMRGNLYLLRFPLSEFGTEAARTEASQYDPLPPTGRGDMINRFVGDYLLYTSRMKGSHLYATRWNGAVDTYEFSLPQTVQRIESMGDRGLLIGPKGGDLYFSTLKLGAYPTLARESYIRPHAVESQARSHGFFYKPLSDSEGLVGLPIIEQGSRPNVVKSSVLFLHRQNLHLTELGALYSESKNDNDDCRVSCFDWYGQSRPIFLEKRIFALMGYDLVEGKWDRSENTLTESQRLNFMPIRKR